jgi:hypothetical protein
MSTSLHRIALSLAVAFSCTIGGIDGAEAQRAPSKGATKGASAANDTDRALDGAAKALDSGNADAAMSALDGVLSGGGLSNKHMARALYLRGLAHRRKGRPAQAIADLTSAVWLKDGLSEGDRNAALAARSEVSREVGVAAPAASGGSATASAPSTSASAETAPQPAPQARVAAAPRYTGDGLSEAGFPRRAFSTPTPAPSADTASNAPSPAASGPATSSWQSGTTVDANERRQASQPRQQESAAPPPAPPSAAPGSRQAANPPSSGGGLGSFITGLFTGNSSATQAPQGDSGGGAQWRPRTERSATTEQPAAPKGAETRAAAVRTAKVAEPKAKARKGETEIATSAIASGAYRLQIATVRSRKEADTVAARVRQEYSGAMSGRKLEVDETVFGGMGTFYRVRLGPYANVSEPKALCDQLRPKGYDCLVVTN